MFSETKFSAPKLSMKPRCASAPPCCTSERASRQGIEDLDYLWLAAELLEFATMAIANAEVDADGGVTELKTEPTPTPTPKLMWPEIPPSGDSEPISEEELASIAASMDAAVVRLAVSWAQGDVSLSSLSPAVVAGLTPTQVRVLEATGGIAVDGFGSGIESGSKSVEVGEESPKVWSNALFEFDVARAADVAAEAVTPSGVVVGVGGVAGEGLMTPKDRKVSPWGRFASAVGDRDFEEEDDASPGFLPITKFNPLLTPESTGCKDLFDVRWSKSPSPSPQVSPLTAYLQQAQLEDAGLIPAFFFRDADIPTTIATCCPVVMEQEQGNGPFLLEAPVEVQAAVAAVTYGVSPVVPSKSAKKGAVKSSGKECKAKSPATTTTSSSKKKLRSSPIVITPEEEEEEEDGFSFFVPPKPNGGFVKPKGTPHPAKEKLQQKRDMMDALAARAASRNTAMTPSTTTTTTTTTTGSGTAVQSTFVTPHAQVTSTLLTDDELNAPGSLSVQMSPLSLWGNRSMAATASSFTSQKEVTSLSPASLCLTKDWKLEEDEDWHAGGIEARIKYSKKAAADAKKAAAEKRKQAVMGCFGGVDVCKALKAKVMRLLRKVR